MRDGITRLTYQQIEDHWSRKIKTEDEGLSSAEDMIGFFKYAGGVLETYKRRKVYEPCK